MSHKCQIHKTELKRSKHTPSSFICSKCKEAFSNKQSTFDGIYDENSLQNTPVIHKVANSKHFTLNFDTSTMSQNSLVFPVLEILKPKDMKNIFKLKRNYDFSIAHCITLKTPISYAIYEMKGLPDDLRYSYQEGIPLSSVDLANFGPYLTTSNKVDPVWLGGFASLELYKDVIQFCFSINEETYYMEFYEYDFS